MPPYETSANAGVCVLSLLAYDLDMRGISLSRKRSMPSVPLNGYRRGRAQRPARLGCREHGPALEPGGSRTAHRPRASTLPEPAGPGDQLRFAEDDRRGNAVGAEAETAFPLRSSSAKRS